ncbi:Uncharacterized protein TCM_002878 [Theobroma cacao]|uniref:Uncharacterized protein n=1 Tax=Theobroma cacao TaxID=3641 RepID=A0A061DN76_THECC|nr:Uncharacterized protein TCM_002878 [Theobroma cacao]
MADQLPIIRFHYDNALIRGGLKYVNGLMEHFTFDPNKIRYILDDGLVEIYIEHAIDKLVFVEDEEKEKAGEVYFVNVKEHLSGSEDEEDGFSPSNERDEDEGNHSEYHDSDEFGDIVSDEEDMVDDAITRRGEIGRLFG